MSDQPATTTKLASPRQLLRTLLMLDDTDHSIALGTAIGMPTITFQTTSKPGSAPGRRCVSSWMKSAARSSSKIDPAIARICTAERAGCWNARPKSRFYIH